MKSDYFVLLQNDFCCSLQIFSAIALKKRESCDEKFVTAKCGRVNDGATLTGGDLESLTANDRRQTQVVNFSNQEISR